MQPISPTEPIPDDEPSPTEPAPERSALMRLLAQGLLAVVLASCAAPERAPAAYEQGATMAPRPPVFNPTTDAPHTVGQPGRVRPGVRPQPNPVPDRVLPQTPASRREPGIWAVDVPDGGWSNSMWNLILPVPDPADEEDKRHASRCGGTMQFAATWSLGDAAIDAMHTHDKRCLAALLYVYCVSNDTVLPADKVASFKTTADAFVARVCDKDTRRRLIPVFGPIAAKWHELYISSTRGGQ